jgi:hypothetical protein
LAFFAPWRFNFDVVKRALRRLRQSAENAIRDRRRIHVHGHVHVGLAFGSSAAVEYSGPVGEGAVGLHIAVHPLRSEEIWSHRGNHRNRVVQMNSLEPKLLTVRTKCAWQKPPQHFAA